MHLEPSHDCPLCPRLAAFREANRALYPDFFNGPVPVWSGKQARLVIVGLAPGLKGANRTGRPFTGDYAGDLLYATLKKFGLATGEYRQRPDDGLTLGPVMIVNAVRCVPPQNKPTPAEITTCRQFLVGALQAERRANVYLALGRIAHETLLRTLGARLAAHPFAHGAEHGLTGGQTIFDSYHCSRYNTNTGVLTTEMFEDVVGRAAERALT
ncbi:uracil-DNA glycosylase [Devosia nitrariae]|uniref:Type-5 uracil-DNA glycosylase n=1 Tax=Devosia nitrariae TaxID=2071872 RepID=A0ABQ5W9N1_9HYPH|nr:uracil-DNA glycosylase [Devosia nitrariae]GLQ56260.1 uracil-DNA glycosylase [Devosia nitrariae]